MVREAAASETAHPTRDRDLASADRDLALWFVDAALAASAEPDHRSAVDRLFRDLCGRLNGLGFGLLRAVIGVRALHPLVYGRQIVWERGCDCVSTIERQYGIETSPAYLHSPVRHVREGGGPLRRRLVGDDAVLDFPILQELKAEGATDYVILPLRRDGPRTSFVSLATDRPSGFSDEQIEGIERLAPFIALGVELFSAKRMTGDLLAVYLGADAARRVLDGAIRRGTGQLIRAVLWHCDIKGFTALSDVTPAAELIALLDAYFEAMARPVEEKGGEVLKFIGDGVLAIFRTDQAGEAPAVARALEAAVAALANLDRLNLARQAAGQQPLVTKIALHVGEMVYGNVGAADRLDFTVIGPAVNTVARVQALCGELAEPVLATRDFARLAPADMVSRGWHRLRGLAEATELFALVDLAREGQVQVRS